MSMGGGTAVDTALEHPELVRALVVSGVGTSEPEHTDPWTKDSVARYYGTLMSGDIEGWLDVVGEAVAGPHRAVDDVDPDVVRRVREMSRATAAKHTVGETDWHVPVTDTWARATTITAPTLAINGALDAPDLIAMAERLVGTVMRRGPGHLRRGHRPLRQHGAAGHLQQTPAGLAGHPGRPGRPGMTRGPPTADPLTATRRPPLGPRP